MPPTFLQGPNGDPALDIALSKLNAQFPPGVAGHAEIERPDKESFRPLAIGYVPRAAAGGDFFANTRRGKRSPLADTEWHTLADIRGMLVEIDGQSHIFCGVPDCMSWDPPRNVQFCDLGDKSVLIPASLEHALMWRFPDLKRKVIDKMPQLNRVALGKHKAASDIWGRRETWMCANPAAASVAFTSRAPTPKLVFFGKRTGALIFLSCLMLQKCHI